MSRKSFRTFATLALGVALVAPAQAQTGHGSMQGTEKKGSTEGAGAQGSVDIATLGREIHQSSVDGYRLTYRLLDMNEQMKDAQGMQGMPMQGQGPDPMRSHHLMVIITGPDKKVIEEAKVGFMVTGPGGSDQKVMAAGMKGGFGADVDLKTKGPYKVKTKAVVGEKTLMDEMTYAVK
jgi:hypothetical protein